MTLKDFNRDNLRVCSFCLSCSLCLQSFGDGERHQIETDRGFWNVENQRSWLWYQMVFVRSGLQPTEHKTRTVNFANHHFSLYTIFSMNSSTEHLAASTTTTAHDMLLCRHTTELLYCVNKCGGYKWNNNKFQKRKTIFHSNTTKGVPKCSLFVHLHNRVRISEKL